MDPIKYIFEKPALTGKISRWQMLLFEFDIVFVIRKAIKGQAIADYLVDQPLNDPKLSKSLFLDKDFMALKLELDSVEQWHWKLYFDGVAYSTRNEVGVILVSPKGQQISVSVKLNFDCTNNVIEYEACIVGLQVALEFGTYDLSVFRRFLIMASPRNQVDSVSEMCQPLDFEILRHHICLFSPNTQSVYKRLGYPI